MLGSITGVIDWLVANVGVEAALGMAISLALLFFILFTTVSLSLRKKLSSEREWYRTQYDEFVRELESTRAKKSSAEGDAERWACKIDELRDKVHRLERENLDLRKGVYRPEGSEQAYLWHYVPDTRQL